MTADPGIVLPKSLSMASVDMTYVLLLSSENVTLHLYCRDKFQKQIAKKREMESIAERWLEEKRRKTAEKEKAKRLKRSVST